MRRVFDQDLETSLEVSCLPQCNTGSVMLGADVLTEPGESVRCIILLQPAEHLTTSGNAATPLPVRLLTAHAGREPSISKCPGICRSGRYAEDLHNNHPCHQRLDAQGNCGRRGDIDCIGCLGVLAPDWELALLADVTRNPRFGGAFLETRMKEVTSGVAKMQDAGKRLVSKLASSVGARRQSAASGQHRSEDCWGPCQNRAGHCSWCGESAACCRSGEASDPEECRTATTFFTMHHECVIVAPPPRLPGFSTWLWVAVIMLSWGASIAVTCLILRRGHREARGLLEPVRLGSSPRTSLDTSPSATPKELQGSIRVDLLRRGLNNFERSFNKAAEKPSINLQLSP